VNRKAPSRYSSRNCRQFRLFGAVLGQLIEQDHIEQQFEHLDALVVSDEAEVAKAIHEEPTRDRVVPIISMKASCVIGGM